MSSALQLVDLDRITVEDRYRREIGDVSDLAASIDEVGLLQPVVLTTEYRLVAGERRITAVRSLGHDVIEAHVVDGLDDAATLLRAERDENTCRKSLTPTEEHALYAALLELERPKAEQQRRESGKVHGRGQVGDGNFPRPTGESREKAAAGATGSAGRYKTLDKVGQVKTAADDEEAPEEVRETARKSLEQMDSTGRVDGPYQKFRETQQQVEDAVRDELAARREQIDADAAEAARARQATDEFNAATEHLVPQRNAERPYGLAAVRVSRAIEALPTDMNPEELARKVPTTSAYRLDDISAAVDWLTRLMSARQEAAS